MSDQSKNGHLHPSSVAEPRGPAGPAGPAGQPDRSLVLSVVSGLCGTRHVCCCGGHSCGDVCAAPMREHSGSTAMLRRSRLFRKPCCQEALRLRPFGFEVDFWNRCEGSQRYPWTRPLASGREQDGVQDAVHPSSLQGSWGKILASV